MLRDAFRICVPATSANLGPGFDAVGIALGLSLRARVRPARRFSLDLCGPQAPSHGAYADAIRAALRSLHGRLPAVAMDVENHIPLGKGLGSSAAAAVLGVAIARRVTNARFDRSAVARDAARIEGHADNAFAAVYGGAVISASASSVKLPAPKNLRAVVVVPEIVLSTREARALLPATYSREDTAFTAARASLLGAALARGDWRALREAMRDRLHQPYRARAIPGLDAALSLEVDGLAGIALSGAGPSVVAFARASACTRIGAAIQACFSAHGIRSQVLDLSFARRGAMVSGA